MCEPTTAMMAIAMASTAYNVYAQNESAEAQEEAMRMQADNEREEIQDAAEEELGARIRAIREQRARARVAAGESGAMGQSFAAMINQSLQDQHMDAALISKNTALQKRASTDRLNTSLSQIRGVSGVEAGLRIATAGAQGYTSGLSIKGAQAGNT